MSFANNIKAIRKENNLSQEQLAEKLGVSRQSVSKWESSQSYPEMDKILLICKLFDCDIGELMNDNIKEVNETKQQKTKVNKAIEDFFDYITRFVEMFMAMTFKQKVKCIFEQIFNAGVLTLICLLGWAILGSILDGIFGFMEASWYSGIMSIFQSIYIIVAVVLVITILLHIFKIRYLDYYEIIKPEIKTDEEDDEEPIENKNVESQDDEQNEPKRKSLFSRKREKIIIRDPKHSSSKFLVSIMKAIVVFFKMFLGFIGICIATSFVCITALLITTFLFVKTGLLFIGAFLIIAALLAINYVVLRSIYNFLTSRKSRKDITAWILIISLVVSGIGVGFTLIGTTQFNIVDTHITTQTEFTIPMNEKLDISCGFVPVKYMETDSNDVKIKITHSKYWEMSLYNYDDTVIHINLDGKIKTFDKLRTVIKDINNKQINSYLFDNPVDEVIVYSSKANIEKIKANNEYNLSAEEEIQKLLNQIEKLENENVELKDKLAEKKWIIEEMETEIKDKDVIIEDLNSQIEEMTE